MAITTINVGTTPNDGTGDSLRTSFTICNNNFSYLESIISGNGIVSANSLIVSGNVLLGESLSFTPPGAALQYGGTANSYVQMIIQNKSSLTNASSDYVVTADNGNDSAYFGDFGIASSTYYYAGFESILPNDTYVLSNGGNLLLNAGSTDKSIKFVAGGSGTADIVGQINNTAVTFNQTTISTSTTSGALQLAGGAGIAGSIYSGGNVSAANSIVSGNGIATSNTFNDALTSGLAIDYVSGNGRISLSGVADGLKIYNNGLAGTQVAEISSSGNLSITGGISSTDANFSGNVGLASNASIFSTTGFNIVNINAPGYRVINQFGSNATSFTANLVYGTSGIVSWDINSNITVSYGGAIDSGVEKKYFIRNVGGSSANIILPNSNNNKASNVILINSGAVASLTLTSLDTTSANIMAIIVND